MAVSWSVHFSHHPLSPSYFGWECSFPSCHSPHRILCTVSVSPHLPLPVFSVCSVASVMSDSLQPMDYSPPGSSLHGIIHARMLKWVPIYLFLTQGSNLGLLPWHADSLLLRHLGSPILAFNFLRCAKHLSLFLLLSDLWSTLQSPVCCGQSHVNTGASCAKLMPSFT